MISCSPVEGTDVLEVESVDVVVEGVSMLLTQRTEFASIIERNGGSIRPLLAHLEQRVALADRPPG